MVQHQESAITQKRRAIQRKRRRDADSRRFSTRDGDLLRFGAQQTFTRFDTVGEYLAPGHAPATAFPSLVQLADVTPSVKRDWPGDLRHRLMAVSRLMRKLEAQGYVEIIQPWSDQPAWFRVTAQALRLLGLDWAEIFFPAAYADLEARLRHDRYFTSHHHLINQVRLLLARGGANAPAHLWKSERELEEALPSRTKGMRRPHKADGVLGLLEEGSWEIVTVDGTVLDRVRVYAGQIIAVEVECTQKGNARLAEILPDLLAHHDAVWYFCRTAAVRRAVADARRKALSTDEERRRVRILLLEDYLPCP